jgi:hypothetical protein
MAKKNSSWPAGEHTQSMREGLPEAFVKKCGALAGMFTVMPALTQAELVRSGWFVAMARSLRRFR